MTQSEVARSIVRQLRLLDPAISAEVGTPERKIIDVVAQQIAERSVDLNQIEGVLDIDAKFGTDLENFLGLFRFGRQQGTVASGFVTFSRETASTYDILIPRATVVTALGRGGDANDVYDLTVLFTTTQSVILRAGQLSIDAPVSATEVGSVGNVDAGAISGFGPSTIAGITDISNALPTTGGLNRESDEEFKVRFKNTVFRNVSGTSDQFLALAVATKGTTKANVVGPISRHVEYIQVPDTDDFESGNGIIGEWTSALSSIPYSKHTYDDVPYYVIDGGISTGYFLRRDIDYSINVTSGDRNRGDAYRQNSVYDGDGITRSDNKYRPNVTFKGVLSDSVNPTADALRPGKVVKFEHSYMSESSRNDYANGILNCVDVFINGTNYQLADAVLPLPTITDQFVNDPANVRHYNNYRRDSKAETRPVIGNLFQPLFWQPVASLPDTITIGANVFDKGIHYWLVEDISELGGTVRARNGFEWNPNIPGRLPADAAAGPYTGQTLLEIAVDEEELDELTRIVEVEGYSYNRNVIDLQSSLEADKQVTSDVLAHAANRRYFKVDVAIMYASGAPVDTTNQNISRALSSYFNGLYFGSYIQLSDVLQVIHSVGGVDNVKWSLDHLKDSKNFTGDQKFPVDSEGNPRWPITECDRDGNTLTQAVVDRVQQGSATNPAIDQVYLTGTPHAGKFTLSYGTNSQEFPYNTTAADIEYALREGEGDYADLEDIQTSLTVSGSGEIDDPWTITWFANGAQDNLSSSDLLWGQHVWDTDFALKDDELPATPEAQIDGDSAPGVVVRVRAQNTWDKA
jgi:hypothetical protein